MHIDVKKFKYYINPAVSMLYPLLIVIVLNYICATLTKSYLSLSFFHFIVITISGVIKIALDFAFRKLKIESIFNSIREFILCMAFYYIIFCLAVPGNLVLKITAQPGNIYPLMILIIYWLLTAAFHHRFKNWEIFITFIEGKEKALWPKLMNDSMVLCQLAFEDIKKLKDYFMRSLIVICLLLLICWIIYIPVFITQLMILVIFIACSFAGTMLSNVFLEDFKNYSEAFNFSTEQKKKRSLYTVFFILIVCIAFIPFAGNKALLKFPVITLKPAAYVRIDPDQKRITSIDMIPEPENENRIFEADYDPIFGMWLNIILWVIIISGILIFLFQPAAGLDWKYIMKQLNLLSLVKRLPLLIINKIKGLGQGILLFFITILTGKKQTQRRFQVEDKAIKSSSALFKRGVAFKREVNTVIRYFLKIIKWGGKKGIPYHYSLSAADYIDQLIKSSSTNQKQLSFILLFFEEALFSAHKDLQVHLKEYCRAVNDVVKSR